MLRLQERQGAGMTREEKLECIEVAMRCSWLTAKISDEDVDSVYEAMMGDDGGQAKGE